MSTIYIERNYETIEVAVEGIVHSTSSPASFEYPGDEPCVSILSAADVATGNSVELTPEEEREAEKAILVDYERQLSDVDCG